MIGTRLKIARAAARLSLRDLAERMESLVSAQMIGRYERNEATPGPAVLAALTVALDISEAYLTKKGPERLESVEFRRSGFSTKKEERGIEAVVLDEIGRNLAIEDILGIAGPTWKLPEGVSLSVADAGGAEDAARQVRVAWSAGQENIPNLAEFLEDRGIRVLNIKLPSQVSGLAAWIRVKDAPAAPIIVVNSMHTGERQRLTLSHEAGHLLIECADPKDEETLAYRFGSAFLMPAHRVRAELGERRQALAVGELIEAKRLFGVSAQALAYRCKDLEIISQANYRQLFDSFEKLGWRSPPYSEPNPVPKELSRRFHRLCFRALSEGLISDTRAADLLQISVLQLDQEIFPEHGESKTLQG